MTAGEIKTVIKKLLAHRIPGSDDFTGEFCKTFKEDITLSFSDDSKRSKKMEDSQTLFMGLASS